MLNPVSSGFEMFGTSFAKSPPQNQDAKAWTIGLSCPIKSRLKSVKLFSRKLFSRIRLKGAFV